MPISGPLFSTSTELQPGSIAWAGICVLLAVSTNKLYRFTPSDILSL